MNRSYKSFISMILCVLLILTVSVTAFATEFTGSGTSADPYKITSAAELDSLSSAVAAGNSFQGKYFILTNDIVVSPDFSPIGTKSVPFKGTFNGNGKTLSGAEVYCDNYAALFAYCNGAAIKNLTVSGTFEAVYDYAAAIAAYAENTTITNCVCDASVYAETYTGGIAAYITSGSISNCSTTSSAIISGYVEDCGGIAGYSAAPISNCTNNTSVSGETNVGGIVGTAANSVLSSTNTATIRATGTNYGGIAGLSESTVKYCKNTGSIKNDSRNTGNAGGIVGVGYKADISECINAGSVSASANYAGGIAGYLTEGSVSNCVAAANVTTSQNYAGGIFGYSYSTAVSKCIFTASVSTDSSSATDGAIGSVSGGTVTDCYYNSDNETRVLYTGKATNTVGIASSSILDSSKYTALDFNSVWATNSFHATYPLLNSIPYHSLTVTSVSQVSCTADGVKEETCSLCKEVIKTVTPAFGHSYKTVSSKAATCTSAGFEDKLCSTCKTADSVDYPATGHKDANNDNICDVCNASTKNESTEKNIFEKIADFFNKIIQWIIGLFN